MKVCKTIHNIIYFDIISNNEPLVLLKEFVDIDIEHFFRKTGMPLIGHHSVKKVFNHYFIQKGDLPTLDVFDSYGNHVKTIDCNFALSSLRQIKPSEYIIANRETKTYWIVNNELSIYETNWYARISDSVLSRLFLKEKQSISLIEFGGSTPIWQADLSQTGQYLKPDGSLAPHNEIDGELMGHKELGLVYVPMAGGQLVALDVGSGKVKWVKQYQKRENGRYNSGKYGLLYNKIYKTDGLSLIEIDAETGRWDRTLDFNDLQLILNREFNQSQRFFANGSLQVYDDVIIMYEVRNSQIVVVDRESFSLKHFVHIPNIPGIPNSKDAIQWLHNRLYVLDMERTLHVFEG